MSAEKELDRFEQELKSMLKEDGGDEAQDLVFSDAATQEERSEAAAAPTPSSQPDQSAQEAAAATQREYIPELEPIEIKASDALNGVLDFGAEEGDVPAGSEENSVKATNKTRGSGVKLKLAVSVIVLLGAGYLMLPAEKSADLRAQGSSQTPHAVAAAGAATSPAVAQEVRSTTQAGSALAVPTAPAAPAAQVMGLDLSVMGESPQSQESLVAEIARDVQAIPEAERTCSSGQLSNGERAVCNKTGHIKFFQCTGGTGRIWDVRLPGCDVI